MTITGHIQNGVIVLDAPLSLPEGAAVTIVVPASQPQSPTPTPKRVEFPLVRTGSPGTWNLTNAQIAEALEEEDIEAIKRSGNVPS
jgi:hypothetical protein